MDKALYVAMTGASASLRAQASVANNLANVDTAGFKAELAATEAFQVRGPGWNSRVAAVPIEQGFDRSVGAIHQSDRPLDIALLEGRWLAVQATDGTEAYTRNGQLQVNALGQLTTSGGEPVLGEGGPIAIPPYQQINIGSDGSISIVPQGQTAATVAIVGRLRVVDAPAERLQRRPDGLMRDTQGGFEPAAGRVLTSGAYEGSNVNAASEMVQMIQLQRQYEMQVKVISRADENARSANGLLKLS
ncbi:MAG TPA: flagellar basal-body rod protein FlgF [Arenimonas sp.]|nr:flagellar basal-body rod protein FlgF [Arenimonas sp.]